MRRNSISNMICLSYLLQITHPTAMSVTQNLTWTQGKSAMAPRLKPMNIFTIVAQPSQGSLSLPTTNITQVGSGAISVKKLILWMTRVISCFAFMTNQEPNGALQGADDQ